MEKMHDYGPVSLYNAGDGMYRYRDKKGFITKDCFLKKLEELKKQKQTELPGWKALVNEFVGGKN